MNPYEARVLAILRAIEEPVSVNTVAMALSNPLAAVRKALKRLAYGGLVRKSGNDWRERWSALPGTSPRRLPLTRGDCVNGPRPCPHVTCVHHMLDATETCMLDVTDQGELSLQAVGNIFGISKERVQQIEERAMAKLRE